MLVPGLVMQQPPGGDASVFAEAPFPGDVDVSGGDVYVTETDLMNDGSAPPAGAVPTFPTDG